MVRNIENLLHGRFKTKDINLCSPNPIVDILKEAQNKILVEGVHMVGDYYSPGNGFMPQVFNPTNKQLSFEEVIKRVKEYKSKRNLIEGDLMETKMKARHQIFEGKKQVSRQYGYVTLQKHYIDISLESHAINLNLNENLFFGRSEFKISYLICYN